VATITLNRPRQRNAVGDGMREELADAYRTCDRDDDVRVIVLTGAPPAFCAGADLTLALQCDIRFFAADACYGVVQVRRGVVGDAYSHWILPRLVGIANAAEILLTGATFDGHRAVALGLGSRVLDADDVLPEAMALAHDIAENTAPMSVAASKRLLWDSFDLDRAAVGDRETDIHRRLMGHDDAKEGVRAYLAGRPPEWTGKPSHHE
jgi:enoyl-CoA hydratase/carnithine racemase